MKKYSGIDLHSTNNVVVIIDDADRVLFRRRLPNELGKVLEALELHRRELAGVALEWTYNLYGWSTGWRRRDTRCILRTRRR